MTSATQLIYGALRLLGVLRSGMGANPDQMADGLVDLNDLVDNWSTDRLKVWSVVEQAFALVSAQQTYTIGPGGNFNAPRPSKIEGAVLITNYSGQAVRSDIAILDEEQWREIAVPNIPSLIPYQLYCDYAAPLANISLFPVPSDPSAQVQLSMWQQISSFATLASTATFPPGYALALRYGLAVQMAPSFAIVAKNNPNLELIIAKAAEYRAAIESLNAPSPRLSVDLALRRHSGSGYFNWINNRSV